MTIKVPKPPPQSDHASVDFATEIAFNNLIRVANSAGLDLEPVMGLMYLPDQETTRQFQLACRAVIASLRKNKPETKEGS